MDDITHGRKPSPIKEEEEIDEGALKNWKNLTKLEKGAMKAKILRHVPGKKGDKAASAYDKWRNSRLNRLRKKFNLPEKKYKTIKGVRSS